MELQQGYTYIAYKNDNPLKNFKFTVKREEDLFVEAEIVEGIVNIELWKPYVVKLPNPFTDREYLEISPYEVDEEKRLVKFIILGYLVERRKFVRFNVLHFNIPIESEYFKGVIENISLGGVKIQIREWKNRDLKEGEQIYVKATLDGKDYHFIITPVAVRDDFISAKFEKPARITSELFYQCLKKLDKETSPISEKRKFRRFYVEPLKIIVDTPLGMGILVDISLGGMRVQLKRQYSVDPEVVSGVFSVSCYIPEDEEYVIDVNLVNRTKEGTLFLKIARWDEEALRFVSKILEKLVETKKV